MSKAKKFILSSVLLCSLFCVYTINEVSADINNSQDREKKCLSVVYEDNENINEAIESYLNSARIGYQSGNPLASIESLIKAENLLKNVPANKDLQNSYNIELSNFYSKYEQFENALNAFNDVTTNDISQKIFLARQKAWYYNSLKKFSDAKKELEILQNLTIKELGSKPSDLFYYYIDYSYYLLDSCQFDEFVQIKDKLQSLLSQISAGEEHVRDEIDLNQLLITYYISKNMQDKALEVLNTNAKLAEANSIDYKDNTTHYYKDYYYSIKDFKSVKKIIDEEAAKIKKLSSNDNINLMYSYNNYINYYNNLSANKRSEKYAAKMVKLVEPYKNIIPIKYANTLKKAARVKNDRGENEEALRYINEAERYYAKATSQNSYPYYDTNKTKGEIYSNMGKFDEALEYYIKAENILKNLQGSYFTKESYEIKQNIASIYANKNDYNNAIQEINNAIKTAEKIFNKNNVEVQKLISDKINILNRFEKNKEAEEALNQISEVVDNNKMEGYDYDFCYEYYTTMIYRNIKGNNKDKALNYLQKAEKYATNKYQKKEIKNLKTQITKN